MQRQNINNSRDRLGPNMGNMGKQELNENHDQNRTQPTNKESNRGKTELEIPPKLNENKTPGPRPRKMPIRVTMIPQVT